MPRANDNRMRAKAGRSRVIPASGELMRLYADYGGCPDRRRFRRRSVDR
jgi:hypothetical protein